MKPVRPLLLAVLVAVASAGACASDAVDPPTAPTTTVVPATAAPRCQADPTEVSVIETEPVSISIDCPDTADLTSLDLPVGAELRAGRLAWTPALDQAGTHIIDLGGAAVEIVVADAFDRTDHVPVLDPLRHPQEFGLDVFHVFSQEPLSASFEGARLVAGGRDYDAEVRVRGALSREYPKPNLTVRVDDGFDSPDPDFDGLDRLVLVAGFDDRSQIRNRLAQQLWADLAETHLRVPHRSVVLYLDGRYQGLYTLLEDVDDDYLRRHGLDDDGQLFKANDSRADFSLDDDPDPTAGFEKQAGEPLDGPAALGPIADVVELVAGAPDERFSTEVGEWVDLADVYDWFVFVTVISAGDSADKNAYWYQPDGGGPFRYIPWDFNHSFGQDFVTRRVAPEDEPPDAFAARNRLFARLWADPFHREAILDRFDEALAGPLSVPAIDATIDGLEAELGRNLARDVQRWDDEHRQFRLWADRTDIVDGATELEQMRDWVRRRHDALTAALASARTIG